MRLSLDATSMEFDYSFLRQTIYVRFYIWLSTHFFFANMFRFDAVVAIVYFVQTFIITPKFFVGQSSFQVSVTLKVFLYLPNFQAYCAYALGVLPVLSIQLFLNIFCVYLRYNLHVVQL